MNTHETNPAAALATTLTMDWGSDFHADGSITDSETGELIVPAVGETTESADLQLDHSHRRTIRWVDGVPGQCRPIWGQPFADLVGRGLIVLARPTELFAADRYDLTPSGESALAIIGERG